MSDWRDRLKSELAVRNIKRTRLAEELGFNRDYITRMLKPGSNPGVENIRKVCEAIGASFTYVFTGEEARAPVYDEVISEMSEMTTAELKALRDHLRRNPLRPTSKPGSDDKA